jgi:nucleoside 2-deoxyribosyltransferase
MFNPEIKYAHSKGVDLPLMYIYLAGYMSGNKLYETTVWRKDIRNHYRNYEKDENGQIVAFPFVFLDPYNGKEFKTISGDGVTSHIPPTAIRKADKMSVKKAEIVIANMNTFGEPRPMIGTHHEICWAQEVDKPIILICDEKDLNLYKNHPFTCDCDYYLTDYKQVYEQKILELYYRRIAGAIY